MSESAEPIKDRQRTGTAWLWGVAVIVLLIGYVLSPVVYFKYFDSSSTGVGPESCENSVAFAPIRAAYLRVPFVRSFYNQLFLLADTGNPWFLNAVLHGIPYIEVEGPSAANE